VSLLSTKRTPSTPCYQHCAERCSRASPTPSPSSLQKRRALSLNPSTQLKRLHRSTSWPLQIEPPQAGCIQHDRSPSRVTLTKKSPRARTHLLSCRRGQRDVYTQNSSPTQMESVRTQMNGLAGYNLTFDHGTRFQMRWRNSWRFLGHTVRRHRHRMHKQSPGRGRRQRWRMTARGAR
jgi:hypothetical protein